MRNTIWLIGICFLLAVPLFAAEPTSPAHELQLAAVGTALIADDFKQVEKANRRLTRGNWTVKDGEAACAHDDELFKKYKNHGPAIWYDQEFTDGVIKFEFQPSSDCKQFVFTVNGREGHVFRFVMNEQGTDIRAWDADHKGQQLATGGPALPKSAWFPVTVEMIGRKACVHLGDKYQAVVEDASYATPKSIVGVSFHYGQVRLRNFEILPAKPKNSEKP